MRTWKTRSRGFSSFPIFVTQFVVLILTFTGRTCAQSPAHGNSPAQESALAAQVRALNNSILQLHGQLQESQTGAAGIRSQAAIVLAQRAASLAALIEENPRAALAFAFSPELLADLARKFPGSASQLESHATLSGPIEHWIFDSADLKTSRSLYQMKVRTETLNLYFAAHEPPALQGAYTLQVTGVVAGLYMAVETSSIVPSIAATASTSTPTFAPILAATNFVREQCGPMFVLLLCVVALTMLYRAVYSRSSCEQISRYAVCAISLVILVCNPSIASAQTACTTTGAQNTVVLLVNFQDTAISVTPLQASNIFFDTSTGHSLNGYWQEASYGQTSATGSVFGPYTVGASTSYSCVNMTQLMNDAIAAASASGVNFQNYTRIDLVFPGLSCGWAGVTATGSAGAGCSTWTTSAGTLTASVSYLVASYFGTRDQGVELVAHENGHQLGLDHAGTITNEPTAVLGPTSSPGTLEEFNDFFSVMGTWTLATYSAQHKSEILNWMASGVSYQTVQSGGTYTLQPIETNPAGLQGLKVLRGTGNNGDYLWIEYRQPIGNYDSTISFMNFSGALIHYEDSTTGKHTHVLDFTPSDVGSWYNTVLAPGQTWADPYSDVSISVLSATSTSLTVSVNYSGASSCISSAPSVSVSPLDPSIYPGQTASYSATVTNNDSSGCSSSAISLGSSAPSGWSTSLSSSSVTLSPGQSASITLGKGAPSGTPAGTYAVNLNASNSAATGAATANATVMTPPSIAVTVSVSGSSFTRPGTVPIIASVTNGGTPASGASVTFTLTAPNGSTSTQTATTGTNGAATWNYKLNAKSLAGTYSVSAQAALSSGSKKTASTQSTSSNTASFSVQ
jgi:M6 family metalloprotease-like protein